jgi:hypothetical protein
MHAAAMPSITRVRGRAAPATKELDQEHNEPNMVVSILFGGSRTNSGSEVRTISLCAAEHLREEDSREREDAGCCSVR